MHFEDFIDEMPEEDYDDWLRDDATPKQKEIAMRIREEVPPEEQSPQERKQNAINRFLQSFRGILKRK